MAANSRDIKLLVADSDSSVRSIIRIAAEEAGWSLDEAADGITALKLFRRGRYHLLIVDFDLPELDGRIVCRQIRKSSALPVIFLSLHPEESERLASFEVGGNDYVLKPFYPRELMARVLSLLTLAGHTPQIRKNLSCGGLSLDLWSREVRVDGRRLSLTPKEYDLLLFFCHNQDMVFSRDVLLNRVWGDDFCGSDRTVDSHVKSLRSKITPHHGRIVTVWGVGYKFERSEERD